MEKVHIWTKTWRAGAAALLAAGLLAAFHPLTAHAASGIDMSTDYPGITAKAGESVSFKLDFESLTGSGCDASLSVASMPEGWEGYFTGSSSQITKVHIDSSKEENDSLATFNLTIPDDAQDGTYQVVLLADTESGISGQLELELLVDEEEGGQSDFSAEYPSQQGSSGTGFSYAVTLENNKGTDQSYSLSAQIPAEGWMVSFTASDGSSKVASIDVSAGGSENLTVSVTPPVTVEKGTYTIPCRAVSSTGEILSMELEVEITGSYEVAVSTPTGNLSLSAYANAEKAVTLSITNNGNVDLTDLSLTSSVPSGWEMSFDEADIETLAAGETAQVTAHITPDSDALTGDYVATVTVSNDETSDSAQLRVSVKTRTGWGAVAIVIILALLAGIYYIFKKYGRR